MEVGTRQRAAYDSNQTPYRCTACSQWHLGSTIGRRKRYAANHKRLLREIREKELSS